MEKNRNTVQSVDRAIDLLYCFTVSEPNLSVNDFVRKTGLNRTTVFRLLTSLKEKRLLMKDEERGTYSLSLVFSGFGQIVSENLDVRKEAIPELKKLSSLTKETVSLNILQSSRRMCVEKVEGSEDIRQFVKLGYPYPLVKGASGKVLLAHCEKNIVDEVIDEWNENEEEKIDKSAFMRELERIQHKGYSLSKNDRVLGAYSISTPIFGINGDLVGGLSISGLAIRLTKEKEEEFIESAMRGAKRISKNMGYSPPGLEERNGQNFN